GAAEDDAVREGVGDDDVLRAGGAQVRDAEDPGDRGAGVDGGGRGDADGKIGEVRERDRGGGGGGAAGVVRRDVERQRAARAGAEGDRIRSLSGGDGAVRDRPRVGRAGGAGGNRSGVAVGVGDDGGRRRDRHVAARPH